jgi:PAS domain S-box-containing protein
MNHPVAADIAAVQAISAVPNILEAVSELTGLRFVCVARVEQDAWTACAVLDKLDFGLRPGDGLDVGTTLCSEVRDHRKPIIIDQVSADAQYCNHPTPRMYGFESYFSVPLFNSSGGYFGTLCGIDPLPAKLSEPRILHILLLLADMISRQLEGHQTLHDSRQALRSEKETAERLRKLLQQAPGFIAIVSGRDHVFEMVNEAYCQLVGQRDLLGKSVFEALPELAGQGYKELLDQVFESGKPFVGRDLKVALRRAPDAPISEIHVDVLYQPLFDAAGQVTGIFVQGQDVTETYRAHQAKRLADERLADGMEVAGMVVWDLDLDSGTLSYFGDPLHVLGAAWDNVDDAWRAVHPDDAARLRRAQQRAIAQGGEYHEETRIIRPDTGQTIWLDNRARVLRDTAGKPCALRGVSLDISERKHAEVELGRANQALAQQLHHLRDAERRQSFQLEVADVLRQQASADQIFSRTSELAGRYLNVSQVCYADYDVAGQTLACRASYSDGTVAGLSGSMAAAGFAPAMLAALQNGQTWACADLARNGAADSAGNQAMVAVPVGKQGAAVCCLLVSHRAPRPWRAEEVHLLEDLAERTWNAVQRVSAQEALRQADRRKDEFLAMLAHELRNPLAPISTAAQLLKLTRVDDERVSRTSDVIIRQVAHMTSLIDDLLDVSRVTRGKIVLNREQVDLQRVMADAVEQVRPLIEARRHSFALEAPPGPVMVLGDAKRLVQVLANLLSNAAKYTPEGGRIALRLEAAPEHALLRVTDNGIGMSADLLPHIFELFSQAERASDRSQGGLGLGLPLVKSLVELHGGSVSATSKGLDCGSEFLVRLPRTAARKHATGGGGSTAAPPPPAPGQLALMVVDDNVDAAQMLAMYLENAGNHVTVLHDPQDALACAERVQFDAFLLDIGLPGMDGNALARRLRTMPQAHGALLIAITGYGQRFDRMQSMQAGFDHYLVKPADPATLIALLDERKNA